MGRAGARAGAPLRRRDIEAFSLNTIGMSHLMAGEIERGRVPAAKPRHRTRAWPALRVANAYSMLASGLGEMYELEESERWAHEFIPFAAEHDLDTAYIRSWLAAALVYLGRWDEGTALAQELLADEISTISRITALIALGRVRERRGDPGVAEVLDEALETSPRGRASPAPRSRPGGTRRSRVARWRSPPHARGGSRGVRPRTREAPSLVRRRARVLAVEGGRLDTLRTGSPSPTRGRSPATGRGRGIWAARGCVYEAARALGESADEPLCAMRSRTFEGLGAQPCPQAARLALRERGASVPRGPRRSTRENPADLTTRELEVLGLVAEGLRNAEIADRLVLSRRTVDHHVSAILRKLDARHVERPSRRPRPSISSRASLSSRSLDKRRETLTIPTVTITLGTTGLPGALLEREDILAALAGAYAEARAGSGRLVLVAGEAGVGKTSVVRSFVAGTSRTTRVLVGACDPLFTPRPLGPFVDIGLELRVSTRSSQAPRRRATSSSRFATSSRRARPS